MLANNGDIEQVTAAIVLILQAEEPKRIERQELEDKIGSIVETAPVAGPVGVGMAIHIPKLSVQAVMSPGRWEFVYTGLELLEANHGTLAHTLHALTSFLKEPKYSAIGYNYTVMFKPANAETAAQVIRDRVIDTPNLDKRLGHAVNGAAAWLYMDVEDTTFWLRVEPRGSDKSSKFVWANGNFDGSLDGTLPSEVEIKDKTRRLYDTYLDTLKKL